MDKKEALKGPGGFFAAHPALFIISLAGAAFAAAMFAVRASKESGGRRFGWIALAAFEIVQIGGIVAARCRARCGQAIG